MATETKIKKKRLTTKQKNDILSSDGKKLKHYGMLLRAFPTPKQLVQINQTIGCSRFAFNFYLSEKKEVYEQTKETLKYSEFKPCFNGLKEHHLFHYLKNVDKFALESALENVDTAYKNFFNGHSKFPKLKSKHSSKQSYSTKFTNNNIRLDLENSTVQLPKLGKVNIRMDKKFRKKLLTCGFYGRILGATVTRHSSGQIYISLKIEETVELKEKNDLSAIPDNEIIGLDLGLTHFLITSEGKKIDNPRFLKQNLKKLTKFQRKLKHKTIGSSNYKKMQQKISKLHLHIANMRKDFLHKVSRKLVNENQVIVLEDLNVKGMIRNKKLARNIADVGWGYFKTFVKYKADWEHKTVVFVGSFFPSSKLCHGCNEKNTLLSLSDRVWICPKCGTEHDRDINAAQNIKTEGLKQLKIPELV